MHQYVQCKNHRSSYEYTYAIHIHMNNKKKHAEKCLLNKERKKRETLPFQDEGIYHVSLDLDSIHQHHEAVFHQHLRIEALKLLMVLLRKDI
jgi:hypothetical protein